MKNSSPLRARFRRNGLAIPGQTPEPDRLFREWNEDWLSIGPVEPAAAVLATASRETGPSARIVRVQYTEQGFVFVTDHRSRKGTELEDLPRGALCFVWVDVARQVRVEGKVTRLDNSAVERLFQAQPREMQILAWVSEQTQAFSSRSVLETSFDDTRRRFAGGRIEAPAYWAGYVLRPDCYEFWQGRVNQISDRVRFTWSQGTQSWEVKRISP